MVLAAGRESAFGAPPPELAVLAWCPATKSCLQWSGVSQASEYRLYRGVASDLPALLTAGPDSCRQLVSRDTSSGAVLTETPAPGALLWFLAAGANVCGEGPAGTATAGLRIVNATGPCTATCADHVKNGAETDIDCGGPLCAMCGVGKICAGASDCETRRCLASHCQPANCIDGLWNQGETDVDCGGDTCNGCGNGRLCCSGLDCQTGNCSGGVCQP